MQKKILLFTLTLIIANTLQVKAQYNKQDRLTKDGLLGLLYL